jgi:L-asparaginase
VDPISVAVRRGSLVEARHRVHAVAVQDGAVIAEWGDPGLVSFLRSSAKPFQALPLVRSRDDVDEAELAIAAASHLARPDQLASVRSLLLKAPGTADDLECGPPGPEAAPARLEHNCSGKHAGMLAVCRARGWATTGYRLPDHPLQQEILAQLAAAVDASPADIPSATDGCGVPTYALPLERMALLFSRLDGLEGGARVIAAMRAHPDLIRGPRAADSMLMRQLPGWAAKGGAEGLLCATGDGIGLALKVEDGNTRAVRPALGEVLGQLGKEASELATVTLENSRGEVVGDLVIER